MGSPHTVLRLTTARVQPSRRGGQGRAGGGDNAPAALRGKVRGVLFLPPKALRQLQNGVIQKIDLIMDTAAIRGRWVGVCDPGRRASRITTLAQPSFLPSYPQWNSGYAGLSIFPYLSVD
mgnify:CR=1 FL=1